MKLHGYLFLLFTLSLVTSRAELVMTTHGKGVHEFWLIYDDRQPINDHLVVFLHGYGASNPGCYGGWIQSITKKGNAVLFPKFQIGTFLPRTKAFQRRTEYVIADAKKLMKKSLHVDVKSLIMVGHSIGGVIAANITNDHERNGFSVSGMILCQPGFKYLKLGGYDTYNHITDATHLLIITGKNDHAAGRKFADKVYTTSNIRSNKTWLEHQAYQTDDLKLTAHHKDPVSPFKELDSKNVNLVIGGAYLFCQTDLVDELAFWNPSVQFIQNINRGNLHLTTPMNLPVWVAVIN